MIAQLIELATAHDIRIRREVVYNLNTYYTVR